jgi:hypothetical protein
MIMLQQNKHRNLSTRDRCYDLNIFAKKFGEKNWRFLLKLQLVFCKNLIITLVFEKNANFFAENCDHNIDPRTSRFALVRKTFLGEKKPYKKSADLHPRQGDFLQRNIFTGLNKTSLYNTK